MTEQLHPEAEGLDARPLIEAAAVLCKGQNAAAMVVDGALASICDGARAMAACVMAGGVLHYAAAGSSGLMAAADAMELGGTFSIGPNQVRIHMAGGLPTGAEMPGATEDDVGDLEDAMAGLATHDVVIAVSASGTTPYTIAATKIAHGSGAKVIGIANNPGSALLSMADYPVALPTPPEVIAGSTRMGAGTAQKIALNMMSTLMAMELGHVHDGMMVNVRADNAKLRERARAIVAHAANGSSDAAEAALVQVGGDVKSAILLASGAASAEHAFSLLSESSGHLRPALKSLA